MPLEEHARPGVELFWCRGYGATSVHDLTDELGLGRASLYNAFGDKHALYLTALDRYREGGICEIEEALAPPKPARQAIEDLLRRVPEEATRDEQHRGCFMLNATAELAGSDPDVARRATALSGSASS